MQCRKNPPNAGHFRTIAPKIVPKVVSPVSCFSASLPDVAVSGVSTKPLVMPTQNYTLMKVAGQNGAFSLVALPQVNSPVGAPVLQTGTIPLQENLKLPIPRYQSMRNKRSSDKKVNAANGLRKIKSEKHTVQLTHDCPCEVIPESDGTEEVESTNLPTIPTEDALPDGNPNASGIPSSLADTVHVDDSVLPFRNKCPPKPLCTRSPIKIKPDPEKKTSSNENGSFTRCESSKVVDSANSMAVLSPVVFGSPVRLISSAPKGKLPILPYSKIKKSIISKCKQSVNVAKVPAVDVRPEFSKDQSCVKTASDISVSSPVDGVSAANQPPSPGAKTDSGGLGKPNGVLGKRRGRKRKTNNEILAYQTKMKLVGNRLVVCKDKLKMQVLDANVKKAMLTKKYRRIMPKPTMEVQGVISLGSCTPAFEVRMEDLTNRNRCHQLRTCRLKQVDIMSLKPNAECKTTLKTCYKCHICDHNFQFKHHLQDHLNTHTNRRPYHCRLCRKAYVHSGSLSTHMKLHHSESRLKKLMCCEFCAKVFGHIRVYFGHLKEVHRVIISTETSIRQPEKPETTKVKEEAALMEREKGADNENASFHGHDEEIKLQIKCGRCDVITPTFSDMKLHLFCEHGDKFQKPSDAGILECRRGTQEDVVKHATHYWKMLNERRNIFKCSDCEEEFLGSSKLRKHVCFSQTDQTELLEKGPLIPSDNAEDLEDRGPSVSGGKVQLWNKNNLNCILCKQVFEVKDELLTHWQGSHNCEDPTMLWTVFSSLPRFD
ncbi:zinc finger protein 438 [Spea bombifrons]|uniref:zinc finger protein 438 n=1 Tax=Spea bombifrons TaxID=233779 RepID=UPI00234BA86A|nr:zinc finger protein 438 [Spea bombifrons]